MASGQEFCRESLESNPNLVVIDRSNASDYQVSNWFYMEAEIALITVVMPIIWVVGVMANIAFIYVVARRRRMRTVTNFYLIHLAIADIVFLCFAMGDKIGRYIASPVYNDQYGLKPAGCALIAYVIQLSYYASIFFVTLVAVEKYYAVCRPVQHRLVSGKQRTNRIIAGAWALASVLATIVIPATVDWTPACIVWPERDDYKFLPNMIANCKPMHPTYSIVHHGFQTIPFFFAMFANFIMYGLIIRAMFTRVGFTRSASTRNPSLRSSSKYNMRSVSTSSASSTRELNPRSESTNRRITIRNQVVRMVVINGIAFFLCLAPYVITSLDTMILKLTGATLLDTDQAIKALWVGRVLSYINSMVNPFVYSIVNPRYRKAFLSVFTCCPDHQDNVDDQTSSSSNRKQANDQSQTKSTSCNTMNTIRSGQCDTLDHQNGRVYEK